MLNGIAVDNIYLAAGVTDLRKSIDGLAILVQQSFELDPFTNSLFVFCNRKRNKLKILRWETNGFWLYYRRLEKGRFRWPQTADKKVEVTSRQLRWLLDGLPLNLPGAHSEVTSRLLI